MAHISLAVAKSPSDALALTNCLIVNPKDMESFGNNCYASLMNERYFLTIKVDASMPVGYVGVSGPQRNWLQLALNDQLALSFFDPLAQEQSFIGQLRLQVDLLKKNVKTAVAFDTDRMAETFANNFSNQIVSLGQPIVMDFAGHNLLLTVGQISKIAKTPPSSDKGGHKDLVQWGVYLPKTELSFSISEDSLVKLEGSNVLNTNAVIGPDFRFEDMGIGGLENEFWTIFRRAFASRIYPTDVIAKLGIQHVKGLILYGPPGTGKTLMARQIAKMLHAREPKIINGPEILNKYVGQSEENIRALFKEAEAEYKAKGDNSQLHIIIFDELDAICRQRGGKRDGTGVGDSVVNQLLAKIDGVEQLNNILVIGMTNRLDMLDEALLRPGRFEVQLEIGLPNKEGRLQIFKIHTAKMRENKMLGDDVDLETLSDECRNFTGAEIVGLINSATSFAINRHIDADEAVHVAKDAASKIKITRADFRLAQEEVHPAYGVDEEQFKWLGHDGVIIYSSVMEHIFKKAKLVIKQVENSTKSALGKILFYGNEGSGKSAIAAKLALESNFNFIKLINTNSLLGLSEGEKINVVMKTFLDAYRSELSLIMIDDIEDLMEFEAFGSRFSSALLLTFRNYLKRNPPEGKRLVIICTSKNKHFLDQLSLSQQMPTQIHVPNIKNISDFKAILDSHTEIFSPSDAQAVIEQTAELVGDQEFSIPVKDLQRLLATAAQDPNDLVSCFLTNFHVYVHGALASSPPDGGNPISFE